MPAWHQGEITFDPDSFEVRKIDEHAVKMDGYKGLYVKDIALTLAHHEFQRLKDQQQATLQLLRNALIDESLPDIDYFPFGRFSSRLLLSTDLTPHA
ncbi:hypothetical protein KBC03_03980 [Patescibacteria group bacterium]|nr:hypothetical protein [Patescibacteria group bacterium]